MPQPDQRSNFGPLTMIAVGVMLLLVVVLWQALNAELVTATNEATPTSQANPTVDPLSIIPRVSMADAKQAYDQHSAFFLDVRDSGSFAAGHIAGAKNIPLNDLASHVNSLDQNQWIITYCT